MVKQQLQNCTVSFCHKNIWIHMDFADFEPTYGIKSFFSFFSFFFFLLSRAFLNRFSSGSEPVVDVPRGYA